MTVVEALARPGGRTHTFQQGAFAEVEEGAHWVPGVFEIFWARLGEMVKLGGKGKRGDFDLGGVLSIPSIHRT